MAFIDIVVSKGDNGIESITVQDNQFTRVITEQQVHISGVNSEYLRFTATPKSGYLFSYWFYEIGLLGEFENSANNPVTAGELFAGREPQTIVISAASTGEYSYQIKDLGVVTTQTDTWFTLPRKVSGCVAVRFANSGLATFYSDCYLGTATTDTKGYLTDSLDFETDVGSVLHQLISNDDVDGHRGDFRFSYEVEAGVQYYAWVTRAYGDRYANVTFDANICIVPPSNRGFYIYNNGWEKATPYICSNGAWKKYDLCLYNNGKWMK